jgi:hypothetical protein
MKTSTQLAVLSVILLSAGAHARVIYGEDNRIEVSEASPMLQKLARSSATMISSNDMVRSADKPGLVQFTQRTLKDWLESQENKNKSRFKSLFNTAVQKESISSAIRFCDSEKFISQPNPGMCSGFLIAPDLIATAGHCAEIPTFCSEYNWVFDFKVDPTTKQAGVDVKEADIYKCKKVVSNHLNMDLGMDYAIVQLDRPVVGREPLEIRNQNRIEDFTGLVVIGAPSGLPQKVAAGATVRKNTHPFFFTANLDAFQGNSGSPVFNAKTGVVEGILVRGEEDFKINFEKMCVESNRCKDSECRGEDVSRLTSVPEINLQNTLYTAAVNGDIASLKKIFELKFWVDIYGKDGQSALIKASIVNKFEVMSLLLTQGANPNVQDVNGNTALHHFAKVLTERNESVFKVMLARGVDLNLKNAQGESALLIAAKNKNVAGAKLLLASGAENDKSVPAMFENMGLHSVAKELKQQAAQNN